VFPSRDGVRLQIINKSVRRMLIKISKLLLLVLELQVFLPQKLLEKLGTKDQFIFLPKKKV
jgi:hypothetical protein